MRGITRRQIIRYTVFPEVKPRMQELFLSGFRQVPYLMALVYQVVRLLPSGHPYLNPANAGKFGVRHVIAEAANNLVISRKNIDQIFLFVTILLGIMLVFVQMGLLAFSIIAPAAMAAMPTNFQEFFVTPAANRAQDIAYIFLDMTFGIPDMFLSCVDPGANEICLDYDKDEIRKVGGGWILSSQGWPYPIHKAMHQTFQFYSIGLLVVAALITSYFVATIVIETAQTGTAFGKRFNKVWAPIRIVMAFGLLVPVGHGLNSAQYIVLYAAKFGSGFATNGWTLFNDTLTEQTFLGPTSNLVSRPNVPEVGNLLQFLYAAKICKILEAAQNPPRQINAYLVGDPLGENYMLFPQTGSYNQMIAFANGSSQLLIRFGDPDYQSNP
ncbi:MAG: type IV secretion protein DotA, partial [Alphaproteobacteria bacterium]|nr:type IV secretion protein DotA [Alphaproteobacteria bacterium]